jgi:hypothetical protein
MGRLLTELDGSDQGIPQVNILSIWCPPANSRRLSYGVIGRLPRVTPAGGAEFNGISIPAGVSLCSTVASIV